MRKLVATLLVALALSVPAQAQISVPNTFVTRTTMSSANVNQNFNELGTKALNRTLGVMTGGLTTQGILPDGNNTRAIGAALTRYSTVYSVLGDFSGAVATGALTVTGAQIVTSTVTVGGNFAINTNKFTVVAASGNTLVAGTLDVTGVQTFTGATALNGAVDIAAGLTAGSGNVAIIDATGKIPALSATYLASLDGTSLTGLAKLASLNTFSARNDFKTYTETKSTSNPSAGAITYDLSLGTHFETALMGNATVTISNVPAPANGVVAFTVKFTADGTLRTFTWPASVVWPSGSTLVFTSTNNKRDVVTFVSWDAGTTWFGFIGGQNF